jgi:hypothetical protein
MRRVSAVRTTGAALVTSFIAGLAGGPARAEGGAATDAYDDVAGPRAIDVHAFLDAYFVHNFDDPRTGENVLREFDFKSDALTLSYLRLTLAHRPDPVGFRLDAGFGATADVYRRQDPASVEHPDLARATSFVGQAFVSVLVPLERTIELDAGKFATPVGLEDNESLGNWAYSRSLLYSWAEPSLHTGVRATSQVASTLALSLFWLNGWNSGVVDGNDMRAFAVAATLRPSAAVEGALVYMGGLERPPTALAGPLAFRNLLDGYLTAWLSERVGCALTADLGHDRADGGVTWWGIGGALRFQGLPWLAGSVRGEYFSDRSGFMTGTPQAVAEVTATVEARADPGLGRWLARLEYRHDRSTAPVFDAAVPAALSFQDTLTLALLATM